MPYYTRVFCTSKETPQLQELYEALKNFNHEVSFEGYDMESEISPQEWKSFELSYHTQKRPLIVELNTCTDKDGLLKEEIQEFLEELGKPKFYEFSKKKVIQHLKATQFIVCTQLPTSDINDQGFEVNGDFLDYIADHFSGLIQADGEGFYRGAHLILNMK
jgi:hypothetical protein